MMTASPDPDDATLGIYLHWPYCQSKCPYCDFNSHVPPPGGPEEAAWLSACLEELRHYADLTPQRRVASLFFGGGSPSLLSPRSVDRLISEIDRLWSGLPQAEITLEANPAQADMKRFSAFRTAGVNRLSLGIQALRAEDLRRLGRRHGVREAKTALEQAKALFPRVSFDLIYGRPGQTALDWERELTEALALAEGHLSLYQLTIEPGTRFWAAARVGDLKLPDETEQLACFHISHALCREAGLLPYEISNFARPGEVCRHNLRYWRYQDYLGIGPGAHGRLRLGEQQLAWHNYRAPKAWIAACQERGHGCQDSNPLSPQAQANERLLMGLRTMEGVDLKRMAQHTGLTPDQATVTTLMAEGYVQFSSDGRFLALTQKGFPVMDTILSQLAF